MVKDNNFVAKIDDFLSSNSLIEDFHTIKFKEFLKKLCDEQLEYMIAKLRDKHSSYRMSHDKFQSAIIATCVTIVITFISLFINLGISKSLILSFEIGLIMLLTLFLFSLRKTMKSNNLKEKKLFVDEEIIKRIKDGKWKNKIIKEKVK